MAEVATRFRLAEVLAGLSLATDLGIGAPLERGLRMGIATSMLADIVGLSEPDRRDTYYASFLVMLGCTSSASQQAALFGDELAIGAALSPLAMGPPQQMLGWLLRNVGAAEPPLRRAGRVAAAVTNGQAVMKEGNAGHCEVARLLSERLGLQDRVTSQLGFVFERWDGRGGPAGIKGEAIPLPVRVGVVGYDLASQAALGLSNEEIVTRIRAHAGQGLDPALADAACAHAAEILEAVRVPSAWDAVLDREPTPHLELDEAGLDRAAEVIADFADLKSRYTRGHSRGVAQLAAGAAQRLGFDESAVTNLRRAALMHDLGRVAVSTAIWERSGPLADGEWEQVRLHAHWSERVLSRMRAFGEVGRLAGLHHERLDGSGYHRSAGAGSQPREARVLAAADVSQALGEERPHRAALSLDAMTGVLAEEVRNGHLDGESVEAVASEAGLLVEARPPVPADLTAREVDVLRLVARGRATKQVARELGISPKTADHHLQSIYGKTGVRTRAGIAVFAMERGLV